MAQGGTLEYSINFNVNKQNLDALQKSLDEIITKAQQTEKVLPDYASPFTEAADAAKDLQSLLKSSWNTKIGQIDLSKVEKGLVNLYGSTKNFKDILSQIGPEGQKVFNEFTQAVLKTQMPVKQTNAMLDKLAISFKNTIRYGISSSIWNQFSNSVKQAYGYVKHLDKSLNDIRIVSGQSADQMERLAIQANKTAQELGKSTLDYTKAALIYYQQGLTGDDVTQRTEVTLKMANVLGESAKEVSDYMTAIWNNFDKGSESLEHYADVITALGASTAASSEEIATGMEKFAAVAKTIGLSYEYATSALATVVAQTRQSADTVGTAFKTIFARMEDLKLGKTLEDGTTLGKYSSTLEKIGVSIKDQTGQLKSMDTILSEMGAKWQTLSKDQQIAVAQGVAGIRQYTQLVALMDNWDSFETNLNTALNSEGTLAQQQQIYLDSIEAHLQQLDAAWEGLYKNVFDEDALKFLTDALTKVINLANTFVTGLGGGLNSIIYIAMSLGNVFSKQISENLIRMENNAEKARKALAEIASAQKLIKDMEQDSGALYDLDRIGVDNYLEELELQRKLLAVKQNLNEADQATLDANQDLVKTLREENLILDKILQHRNPDVGGKQKEGETKDQTRKRLKTEYQEKGIKRREWQARDTAERIKVNTNKINQNNDLINIIGKAGNANLNGEDLNTLQDLSPEQLNYLNKVSKNLGGKLDRDRKKIAKIEKEKPDYKGLKALKEKTEELQKQKDVLDEATKSAGAYKDLSDPSRAIEALRQNNTTLQHNIEIDDKKIKKLKEVAHLSDEELKKRKENNEAIIEGVLQNEKGLVADQERQQQMQNFVSGLFTIGSTISAISGAVKTAFNPDISGWEKISSIFSVLATQSMILFNNWDKVKTIMPTLYSWSVKQLVAKHAENVESGKALGLDAAGNIIEKSRTKEKEKQVGLTATQNGLSIKQLLLNMKNLAVETLRASMTAKIIAGLAAAAVAGYALYKIISLIIGQSEEEKLKERVQETGEAVKKATESYQDLKDKISSYQDAKKGLEGLTEGTVEFYEAVMTANEKAETLIDTLGLLAGKDYSIDASSGLITINENSLKNALREKQQGVFRTQATNTSAKLDLTKYYQREVLSDFTSAVLNKTGVLLSNPQDILKENTPSSTGMSTPFGIQRESDISKEVGTFRAEYNKRSAEMLAQQKQLAAELIQGYATKEDLETYQSLTKTGQDLINSYVAKQTGTEDITTDFDKYEYAALDRASMATTGQHYVGWVGVGGGPYWGEEGLKASYAEQKLGWTYNKRADEWINASGQKANLEDITYAEAVQGWTVGDWTKQATEHSLQKAKDVRNSYAVGQLGENSKDYVTEAAIALHTGQADQYNFSSMTVEEIDALQQAYEETSHELSSLSSYTQEYFNTLKEGVSTEARTAEDLKRYNEEIADQATQLGVSKNALKIYDTALQNSTSDTIEYTKATARAAAETYAFNKNYNTGRKDFESAEEAWKTYTKALKANEDVSYDVADAVGKILDDLEKMGITLNNNQLKDPTVLANIEKLFAGTKKEAEEAYQVLEKLSVDNMWEQWRAQVLKTKDFTSETIDALKESITSLNEGDLIDGSNFTRFREYISNAHMTYDELINFLDANHIKYEIDDIKPVEVKKNTIPGSKTTQKHTIDGDNPYTGQHNAHLEWTESVENLTSDFYTIGKDAKITKGATPKRNFAASSSSNKKSSGSSNKPKTIDPLKEQADRYHEVNTQITKVDNALKKLQSQQSKFVGSKLIKNLTDQWKLLNTQVDNYQEKLKIANGEQQELAEKLAGKGVKFNADGTIGNYMEAFYAQEDIVNNLIAQYNKLSKAQQEVWDEKKTVDNAKEVFNQFKTDLDRYDELVSNFIPGLQQNILDSVDKMIETNIEKFNLEITVTLDLTQATRDWNAWKKRALNGIDPKDIYGNANARLQDFYTYFNNAGTGETQVGTRHLNDLLEELKRMDENTESVYGDTEGNRAKALEDLKTYYTQLMQSITDVIELQDELHQDLLDEMDEIQGKFDEQIESYEYLSGVINHDLKVVQMIYGEDAYDTMDKFYDMQHDNYVQELDFYRKQRDFWQEAMDKAEEGTEEWESAKEKMLAAEQGMEEVLVTGLENAKSDLENAIGGVFQRLNNLITKGMGLDYVNEEWELINKNADRYLDTINKTFGVRQLEQKYVDAINKTNNISIQQKLKKIMDEQLNNLKQRDRLTQYDLDRANKMYEIELARIALQEAQMNKTQMRLRRDSQGNYTYQYVANRTAIEEAQTQLNDLYNSLYNFDKERYNSILNDAYAGWVEYQQKMAEAAMITDPEVRAQREVLIQKEYNEYLTQIEDDYQIARYNLQESAFDDLKYLHDRTYEEMTDYEKELVMDEIVPTWNNGVQEMILAFSGENGFAELTKKSWKEMLDAQDAYTIKTQELEVASGQTYQTIAKGEDEAIKLAKTLIGDNDTLITKYDEELEKVWDVYRAIQKLRDEYKAQADAASQATKEAYEYYKQELEMQAAVAKAAEETRNKTVTPTTQAKSVTTYNGGAAASSSGGGSGGSGGSSGGSGGGTTSSGKSGGTGSNTGNTIKATITFIYNDGSGRVDYKTVPLGTALTFPTPSRSGYTFQGWKSNVYGDVVKSRVITKNETLTAQWKQNSGLWGIASAALGAVTGGLTGYATGGYTGSWENNNGRLAVLHQKELVLNEDDTKNMLNTVAIMRQISSSLGENTLARLAGATAQGYTNNSSGGLFEQNVHIDATFPNVQNSREIEEALNNLVNSASQRVMENHRR